MTRDSTHTIRHKLAERDGWKCCYCETETECLTCSGKRKYKGYAATIEHIKPKKQGGTYGLYNLKIACARCNGLRGSHPVPEGATLADIYTAYSRGKYRAMIRSGILT
jgi:5-methylcytosine-specific restriction endonuclease McrA